MPISPENKRLRDGQYLEHYVKAGDRIRLRATIATGVIASLTTVNLTIGGRLQALSGELVQFGDSLTFSADGAQTARYIRVPEGYITDLIVESTSTGLTATDMVVVVDIVQGETVPVAVGLLAYGYIWPAGLLGLNVQRNIAGGSGGGGMAIGGTVTSGTAGALLLVGSGPVLAQDATNLSFDGAAKTLAIGASLIPVGKHPVRLTGGNDGAGSAALLITNPEDGYALIRGPEGFAFLSPVEIDLVTEDAASGAAAGPVSVVGGTGSGAGGTGGKIEFIAGNASGHTGARLTLEGATDAAHGAVSVSSGTVATAAGLASRASLRIPHGVAPTSPVDGDVWTTTAGIFVQINGVTKTIVFV